MQHNMLTGGPWTNYNRRPHTPFWIYGKFYYYLLQNLSCKV